MRSDARRQSSSLELLRDEWWRSRFLVGTFVVCMHLLACVFFSYLAKLHLFIQHDVSARSVISLLGGDMLSYFDSIVAASVTLAIAHGLAICVYCWRALPSRTKRVYAGRDSEEIQQPGGPTLTRHSRTKTVQDKFANWDHKLEHLCGVGSYELLFFIEIALQTFQVYKLSHLIATPWINRLMVFVIVTNCWFMPIVSVVFRKKTPSFIKVVHLALDVVLEIVYGMAIPLVIFYPYYRDANHIFYDRPYVKSYSDSWIIDTTAENRQIYVTSWIDFCSKMAPGVSLFLRLHELQTQRGNHETRTKTASITKITPQDSQTIPQRNKKRVINGLMFICGLGVLTAHLAANVVSVTRRDPGCVLEMMPFGSTQYTCTIFEVSCTQKHITGTKIELDEALSKMDASSVQGLIFSHCEALSMPPRVKQFPKLVGIKIYNCSIAEWGDDAALTTEAHPTVQFVYLTMTNMSRVPDGLLSSQFPPTLSFIAMCGTDLTELPLDLLDKWPRLFFFQLELSPGITEFPPALYRTSATIPGLSLSSNSITTLPDDVFVGHYYFFFLVSGNPLVKLPEGLGMAPFINNLAIAYTDIAEVPASWTSASDLQTQSASGGFLLAAGDTPLCDSLLKARAQPSENNAPEKLSWLQIQCSESERNKRFYYPLELEMQWREKNRV